MRLLVVTLRGAAYIASGDWIIAAFVAVTLGIGSIPMFGTAWRWTMRQDLMWSTDGSRLRDNRSGAAVVPVTIAAMWMGGVVFAVGGAAFVALAVVLLKRRIQGRDY